MAKKRSKVGKKIALITREEKAKPKNKRLTHNQILGKSFGILRRGSSRQRK